MNTYGYIRGRKVSFTTHATERAIERFKSLSIVFPNDEGYIDLAWSGIEQVLNNPFMDKYLYNLTCRSHNGKEDILVYDTINKIVYAFTIVPHQRGRIIVKTIGTMHEDEWLYNKVQRICWIYKDVFKFSTLNGNVTWY